MSALQPNQSGGDIRVVPPREYWVRVLMASMLMTVFCTAFIGTLWWPSANYASWFVLCVGGSLIFPFSRDLLGLPPRGPVQACLKLAKRFKRDNPKRKVQTRTDEGLDG